MLATGLTHAPTLETERLRLRAHAPADFLDSLALWSDPRVVRFIGGRASTREEAWSRLLRYAGHWSLLGYGFWAVIEKASNRFIGEAGFGDFHRALDAPCPALDGGAPEAGWALAVSAHGRGYATEAMQLCLAWADAHLRPAATLCIISDENAASLSVARKCGFGDETTVGYRGEPNLLLRRRTPATA
ncbi:MAG: GNAT family N-acetyltransferase [Caulobacterales bacterium 68-7]|nr:MAG: GNAT family N-acetyltransferase [Caulobacterales bacterium 68-7]